MLAAGGECIPLREMSPADIADIYVHLFRLRFADSVRCYNRKNITELLTALPHMVTGNVLFFEGAPVAIDLVLCARSEKACILMFLTEGLIRRSPHSAQEVCSCGKILLMHEKCVAMKIRQCNFQSDCMIKNGTINCFGPKPGLQVNHWFFELY